MFQIVQKVSPRDKTERGIWQSHPSLRHMCGGRGTLLFRRALRSRTSSPFADLMGLTNRHHNSPAMMIVMVMRVLVVMVVVMVVIVTNSHHTTIYLRFSTLRLSDRHWNLGQWWIVPSCCQIGFQLTYLLFPCTYMHKVRVRVGWWWWWWLYVSTTHCIFSMSSSTNNTLVSVRGKIVCRWDTGLITIGFVEPGNFLRVLQLGSSPM